MTECREWIKVLGVACVVVATPPVVVRLAKTFVVNYDIAPGSVLDAFSFFNSSVSAVSNATIQYAVAPTANNFAVQSTGPNSGR